MANEAGRGEGDHYDLAAGLEESRSGIAHLGILEIRFAVTQRRVRATDVSKQMPCEESMILPQKNVRR